MYFQWIEESFSFDKYLWEKYKKNGYKKEFSSNFLMYYIAGIDRHFL